MLWSPNKTTEKEYDFIKALRICVISKFLICEIQRFSIEIQGFSFEILHFSFEILCTSKTCENHIPWVRGFQKLRRYLLWEMITFQILSYMINPFSLFLKANQISFSG